MHLILALFLSFRCVNLAVSQALPIPGHSYLLYNQYPGDNPYEYLAWTTSSSLANGATSDNPGVYMSKSSSSATSNPPQSLWTFELQSDGVSYYIYNTDESYGSSEKRLDVFSDGLTPFLYPDNPASQSPGQVWQLISYNDGTNFQLYNVFWRKAIDINGGGVPNYPINGPFMNMPATTNAGEKWQLGDSTPTTSVTTTVLSVQTSIVTPPIQTSTLQGTGTTATTTSTIFVTETTTVTSAAAANAHQYRKRAYVITVTAVVGTVFSVSTSYTTLPISTTYIAGTGTILTITATTTSTIQDTVTITTTDASGSSAVPTTNLKTTTTLTAGSSASPSSTAPIPSATDSSSSGLTKDQQIAIGVGVPGAVFAMLSLGVAWGKFTHRV